MKTGLFKLSTKDLATLTERILNTSQKAIYAMVANHPLLLKLKESFTAYDKVYAAKSTSGMGKDVQSFDDMRDVPLKAMREVTRGFMRVNGLSNQQDAADIYKVFEEFGIDMDSYSYSSENAQMKKLIEKLDSPDNQAKLAKVHLSEMYEMMKARHQAFLEIFDEQSEVNAKLHQQQSATSMRDMIESDLQNYLKLVDVMSGFDSTWVPLRAELNEAVKSAANSSMAPKEKTPVEPIKKIETQCIASLFF